EKGLAFAAGEPCYAQSHVVPANRRGLWFAMDSSETLAAKHATAWGVTCGAGAALCWALGFVAARQGVNDGLSPLVLALHRYIWPGLALIPFVAANGFGDLGGIGWRRGIAITMFGGLPLALWSYYGYVYVPLGHGAIIQPSCAALGGLVLARLIVKEPLPPRRIVGAVAMLGGLAVIGAEALRSMGGNAVFGDLLFVAAGSFFAVFGMLLRLWRISAMPAVAITSILSLAGLPFLVLDFKNMLTAGFAENLMQAIVQGGFAGAGAVYLFTRAVILLGVGRAALFPALVPPFTLLIGYLTLGEVPSVPQFVGLAIVLVGFRLTQQG
ncbi:MAG TPA: DMT family transporter, partial [Xanthobacteraceae bacterium]|nr:DMT family transporter [Xanthobacteraceae bacterium]